jgi:hypothetical protein
VATQLQIYNQALLALRASPLASVSEARESRRVLDEFYTTVLAEMLEAGFWKFAMRTVKITEDTSNTPEFGYSHAHNKPDDWVRTYQLSDSERLEYSLDDWIEESNLFFADVTPIYVRYVSNDSDYGGDLTRFTSRYTKAVAFELAWRSLPKLAGTGVEKEALLKDKEAAISEAKSFEALREPSRRPPAGRWNRARFGRGIPRRVSGGWQF